MHKKVQHIISHFAARSEGGCRLSVVRGAASLVLLWLAGLDAISAADEQVGFEFAKVRHLYNARLKLPENCAIEWFVGGHEINRGETLKFLHRHIDTARTP